MSDKFIPRGSFFTESYVSDLLNMKINRKPQKILQYWEYNLKNIISILDRDQLSSPSKFLVNKEGLERYLKMMYDKFCTLYEGMSYLDFCLNLSSINEKIPNFFADFYIYNGRVFREDLFFQRVVPELELYIGEVFEYEPH